MKCYVVGARQIICRGGIGWFFRDPATILPQSLKKIIDNIEGQSTIKVFLNEEAASHYAQSQRYIEASHFGLPPHTRQMLPIAEIEVGEEFLTGKSQLFEDVTVRPYHDLHRNIEGPDGTYPNEPESIEKNISYFKFSRNEYLGSRKEYTKAYFPDVVHITGSDSYVFDGQTKDNGRQCRVM